MNVSVGQNSDGSIQWITEESETQQPSSILPVADATAKSPESDTPTGLFYCADETPKKYPKYVSENFLRDTKQPKTFLKEKEKEEEEEEEKEKEEELQHAQTLQTSSEKNENGFVFYKCRFCGLTFNFLTTLKAHERVHDVNTPYLCNKCGESFHFMCELEYHAKSHLKQKGYKCDCGRTFFQYTDLLYHYHPGEDAEPSTSLPEPEASQKTLSRPPIDPVEFPTPEFAVKGFEPKHPMRVYSEVRSKPYICQYCSKSYADSRQLAYHMYSHRGERMFNPRASRYLMCRNENSYISPGADFKPPYI